MIRCRVAPVAFMFEKKGLIVVNPALPGGGVDYDGLLDIAVEGGAEDVREMEGDEGTEFEVSSIPSVLRLCSQIQIYTQPTELYSLTNILSSPPHDSAYRVRSAELAYIPTDPLAADDVDEEKAESILRVVDLLESEVDVVKVWTNLANDRDVDNPDGREESSIAIGT
jgi:transcriptional/translational regulatory protein YebC/TACO1